jgi:hypothetical protein
MLIADEPNIREVIMFPMNQNAEDLMMNAPNTVRPEQLKELHIRSPRRARKNRRVLDTGQQSGRDTRGAAMVKTAPLRFGSVTH